MEEIIKKDLKEIFSRVTYTKFNKYWRNVFIQKYSTNPQRGELASVLKYNKISINTIVYLSSIKIYNDNITYYILKNSTYDDSEITEILESTKLNIQWYKLYSDDLLSFDNKVKYYKNIKDDYNTHGIFNSKTPEDFTELEREHKLIMLID